MSRGGVRAGAGRPKSAANIKTRDIANQAAASGLMPLEFMLQALRDESKDFATRMDAAFKAAPYVHAKLASIDANIKAEVDATTRIITELVRPPS